MNHKSAALYFEIHTHSSRPYGYIRSSYRVNGKVCHDTISCIHGCSLDQLQRMKNAFDNKSFTGNDIKITSGREFGASKMLHDYAIKIGLPELIYSRNENWLNYVMAMIIGRIIYAGSKLSLSKVPLYSCLWETCAGYAEKNPVDVNDFCYDAMDELLKRQDLIQKKLAKKHLQEGCVVLYDITSSYFEGDHIDSELIDYGYNRDKKKGHKQIVIGLICAKDGCPVSVEVFKGNTSDSKTVDGKLSEIRDKYGISNVVFVGDRGMLTKINLNNHPDTSTITALTHSDIRKLCDMENVQLSMFDVDIPTEITFPEEPGVRYALRKNPERGQKERATRQAILTKIEGKLSEVANPKRKVTPETLGARVGRIFAKYGNQKYFEWYVTDNTVTYTRKHGKIEEDEQYDGLYVIRTNVAPEEMSTIEFVEAYRKLINVEQAFRNLKTVQLEIRPIFHKTDERIKAHVFVCMLSYYLLWHIMKTVKKAKESKSFQHSIDVMLEIMKARQKNTVTIGDTESEMIANPNEQQLEILTILGVAS